MKKCPKCKTINIDDIDKCENCGEPFNINICPKCGAKYSRQFGRCPICYPSQKKQSELKPSTHTWRCSSCGKMISTDVCPYCSGEEEYSTILSGSQDIKCSNCGGTYSSDYDYCPHCAEPRYREQPKEENREESPVGLGTIVGCLTVFPFFLLSYIVHIIVNLSKPETTGLPDGTIDLIIALILAAGLGIIVGVYEANKSERQRLIDEQFARNQASICPNCGSHDLTIYRNGYDYNKALWSGILGVKGGKYIAGQDADLARCRCNNCGHDWKTKYDYRLIK